MYGIMRKVFILCCAMLLCFFSMTSCLEFDFEETPPDIFDELIEENVESNDERGDKGDKTEAETSRPEENQTEDDTNNDIGELPPGQMYFFLTEDGTYTLGAVDDILAGAIEIPDNISGVNVTSIGSEAFKDVSGITSVVIPDGVVSIDYAAFEGCTGLTRVVIPDSVKRVDSSAFRGCTNLGEIVFSDSVEYIGVSAIKDTKYYNDENNWTDGVLYVGNHLIEAEKTIAGTYTIKPGTKTLAASAFYGCKLLEKVSVPGTVKTVSDAAFSGCENLWQVTLVSGVKEIGKNTFTNCINLESIALPNGVVSIGGGAFSKCERLARISLPDSLRRVDKDAFVGTMYYNATDNWDTGDSLCFLYIGKHLVAGQQTLPQTYAVKEGTLTVASGVFSFSEALKSITLPESLLGIGDFVITGCSSLTDINYGGTQAQWELIEKTNDGSIYDWDGGLEAYVIHCVDGDIVKG